MDPNAIPEPHAPSPTPPIYNFIVINDPKEIKTRSKKRQVRSAVAYYQHHKNDNGNARTGTRRRGWKCREQTQSPVTLIRKQSSQSTMSRTASASTAPSTAQASPADDMAVWDSEWSVASEPNTTFCSTRMNPFDSYPVPWDPVYEPILDFYITYILIDTPAISGPGKAFRLRTLWLPLVMSSRATFYATLSLAGCLMDARRQLAVDTPVLLELHSRAISSINTMLSDGEDYKTDQTIGAVLCLSILESFLGHLETFQMHMIGMSQIVRLRGGLDSLGLDGLLTRMIIWLDFNHAMIYGTDLVFEESIEVETNWVRSDT